MHLKLHKADYLLCSNAARPLCVLVAPSGRAVNLNVSYNIAGHPNKSAIPKTCGAGVLLMC